MDFLEEGRSPGTKEVEAATIIWSKVVERCKHPSWKSRKQQFEMVLQHSLNTGAD